MVLGSTCGIQGNYPGLRWRDNVLVVLLVVQLDGIAYMDRTLVLKSTGGSKVSYRCLKGLL